MIKWTDLIMIVLSIPVSAIAGGLIQCLEGFTGALIAGRRPHHFLQPFADLFSRFGKHGSELNRFQLFSVVFHLLFTSAACMVLFTGDDLLIAVLLLLASNAVLIAGAAGLHSPYARMGAKNESYKFMLYGIVLIVFAICVRQVSGSFLIANVYIYTTPLLFRLPLIFLLVAAAPAIILGKSPFNFSSEMMIEFTGRQTSLIRIAGWFERTLLYGFIYMFAAGNAIGGTLLCLAVFAAQTASDRFLGDLRPDTFVRWGSVAIIFLAFINLLWIFLGGVIA